MSTVPETMSVVPETISAAQKRDRWGWKPFLWLESEIETSGDDVVRRWRGGKTAVPLIATKRFAPKHKTSTTFLRVRPNRIQAARKPCGVYLSWYNAGV